MTPMPKIGMEPIRRKALIDATIVEIGQTGSLDVTVSQIAKRAGISSGLAHHYFGSKEDILIAAMRYILKMFGEQVREELSKANSPEQRLEAIVRASFHPSNFAPDVISVWLSFYVQANINEQANRLLRIYGKRLHSNLVFNLLQLTNSDAAHDIAQGTSSLIDGLYLRYALQENSSDPEKSMKTVNEYVKLRIEAEQVNQNTL